VRVHGDQPRGAGGCPQSSLHEGRFGRMFRRLPVDEDGLPDIRLRYYRPSERAYMPVEFSAAVTTQHLQRI